MNIITQHINSNSFSNIYLLYGDEPYLRNQYRDRLREAIVPPGNEMNLSIWKDEGFDFAAFTQQAMTLPFFAEHRLLIVENSGLFKKGGQDMAAFLPTLPDTSIVLFVEETVDARSKLYQYVRKNGTIQHASRLKDEALSRWIVQYLARNGKKIQVSAIRLFLERTGDDMETILQEMEKLISYTQDTDAVLLSDVKKLTTEHTQTKVYVLSDRLSRRDRAGALTLYHELLAQRETPLQVNYALSRHFDRLLKIKDLRQQGFDRTVIAERLGLHPYAAGIGLTQAEAFTREQLLKALTLAVEAEERIKSGAMDAVLAVEMIIWEVCAA